MDELQLARLVRRVEDAFPGDLVAQRSAWEFIESVFAAWEEAVQPDPGFVAPEAASEGTYATGQRFLDAYRSLLRETGGRFASAVQVLLPPAPGLGTLARAEQAQSLDVDPEVAHAAGLRSDVSIERGPEHLALAVRVADDSQPSLLAGIACLPDETMVVQRFERVESEVAVAHFDLPANNGPIGVVIAIFDEASDT